MKFDYYSKTKKLIKEGHLVYFETVSKYNGISPALILYFDNHHTVAIAKEKWSEFSDEILNSPFLMDVF